MTDSKLSRRDVLKVAGVAAATMIGLQVVKPAQAE